MYRRLHVGARAVHENNIYELVGHDKAPYFFFLLLTSPRMRYDTRTLFWGLSATASGTATESSSGITSWESERANTGRIGILDTALCAVPRRLIHCTLVRYIRSNRDPAENAILDFASKQAVVDDWIIVVCNTQRNNRIVSIFSPCLSVCVVWGSLLDLFKKRLIKVDLSDMSGRAADDGVIGQEFSSVMRHNYDSVSDRARHVTSDC